MNFDAYIYEIKLNYDKQKLINEGECIGYNKTRATRRIYEARIDNFEFLKKYNEINNVYSQIKNIFKKDIKTISFYKLPIGEAISPHKDHFNAKNNVGFAINILLTEDNQTPLKFIIEDKHYDIFYNCILFNAGNVMHYVPKVNKERILIRYFVKDMTYEEGKSICQNQLHT
jgi:hypothetical protein|tara:strand:+ start:6093 stop:6608 length:516 start_codon:yes stop_codon:yes gene_type:complete